MSEKRRNLLKWLLPLVILVAGVAVLVLLMLSRKSPEHTDVSTLGQLVETVKAQPASGRVTVETHGTVVPTLSMTLVPRVSGYVVQEFLEPGKAFVKGELLFEIDREDYSLAEIGALAQVKQAENALAEVRSRASSARLEWERLPQREGIEPSDLLLFKPQLAAATAQLEGARANLAARRLDLKRCQIRAPFNCRVLTESVAPGQFIRAGEPVAKVVGSDTMDLVVPVTDAELLWVEKKGEVWVAPAQGGKGKKARLVRRLADVDPSGRMARLLVRVNAPYADEENPVAPNMYLKVVFSGRPVEQGVLIPEEGLVDGKWVHVMTPEAKLSIREVQVMRRLQGQVVVMGEITEGEEVVVSSITGAAPGMVLRRWEGKR